MNYLLALEAHEADLGSHGFTMTEATDPANAHAFIADTMPTFDYVAKAIGDAQDAYYKQWPDVSRNGHLWSAHRAEPKP